MITKKCASSCNEKHYKSDEPKPNLIFLGAPGAGKGSIAAKLVAEFGYFQLSTGDMFRQEIRNKTPLGLEIKSILASGGYVDNNITNQLVQSRLSKLTVEKHPFILDGYPRTLDQADFLSTLESQGVKIDKVVLLKITGEQIIDRLSKRRVCPICKTIYHLESFAPLNGKYCIKCEEVEVVKRPDDEPEVIKKRLSVYENQTKCLIDYYSQKGILIAVNSFQELDKVYVDVKKALGWL